MKTEIFHTNHKIAYHNDHEVKVERVARVNWHKEADVIAQGRYFTFTGEPYQVDIVTCSLPREAHAHMIQGDPHTIQSEYTGIHPILSKLHDKLFEGTEEGCAEFALRVFETLKVGADTERIAWTFIYELLGSELIQKHVQGDKFKQQREAIEKVRNVYTQALRTSAIGIAKAAGRVAAVAAARAAYIALVTYITLAAKSTEAATYIEMRELLLDIQAKWNIETQTYTP